MLFYELRRLYSFNYKVLPRKIRRQCNYGCEKIFADYKHIKDGSKLIKIENDPRITRFGKIMRNTSINELPQLVNARKGDMSIVGNRPLPL